MIEFIENANNWLILGTFLIIIEVVLFGSFIFFLPAGIGAIIIGLVYKIQSLLPFSLISSWAASLVLWGIVSIGISFFIQKYFKSNTSKDINDY